MKISHELKHLAAHGMHTKSDEFLRLGGQLCLPPVTEQASPGDNRIGQLTATMRGRRVQRLRGRAL